MDQRLVVTLFCVLGSCHDGSTGLDTNRIVERWFQPQSGFGRARPAVNGNVVIFGAGDGQIVARTIASGSPLWSTLVDADGIKGANLLVRSNVVVAPSVFRTTALDAQTGQILWKYEAPLDTVGAAPGSARPGMVIDSRIDADNDMVFIPAWGASVSAVDIRSGAVRWIWQPGVMSGDSATSGVFASGSMGVKVTGDTVFATLWHFTNRLGGTSEPWLVAIQKTSGVELWRLQLPLEGSGVLVESAPALFQNLVIVHSLSARTFAVDRSTRQVVWQFSASGHTVSTLAGPEVAGSHVYVDAGDGAIYQLRGSDGTVEWRGVFGVATTRDMLVTDTRVIFPTGTELHVIDRSTGNEVSVTVEPHSSDPLFGSAAASSGGLVFITVFGGAWCFVVPYRNAFGRSAQRKRRTRNAGLCIDSTSLSMSSVVSTTPLISCGVAPVRSDRSLAKKRGSE